MYFKINQVEAAIDQFEVSLKLEPSYENAVFNLAVCYQMTGRDSDAIKRYNQVLKVEGEDPNMDRQAYQQLGLIL